MKPEEIVKLLMDVEKLKEVDREGWKHRGITKPESVAEHTLGVAFLAMTIAEAEGLNVEKSLRMALVHDLPESRIGDISFHSPRYPEKESLEAKAADEILSEVPDYHKAWMEYSKGESPEARLVKYADKLELLAQAVEYEKKGYDVSDFWEEEYVFVGAAKRIYDLLMKSRRANRIEKRRSR